MAAHDNPRYVKVTTDAERIVNAHRAIRGVARSDGQGIEVDSFSMAVAAWECFTGALVEPDTFDKALNLAFDGDGDAR